MDLINGLRQLLDDRQRTLSLAVGGRMRQAARRVGELNAKLSERHPRHAVAMGRQKVNGYEQTLRRAVLANQRRLALKLDAIEGHLRAVGPEQVLRRGYTITTIKKDGAVLRSVKQLKGGETLVTRMAEGSAESIAEDPEQPTLF
jgi:exodeoxyribonuclease VII large subunit